MDQLLPQELLHSLEGVKDFDKSKFIAVHDIAAPVSIRYNPHKFHESIRNGLTWALHTREVHWSSYGFYLQERPVFTLDPIFHAGAYYVQEASSMFIEYLWKNLLDGKEHLNVLDLCAAPGGKTSLLSGLKGIKMLLANEIIKSRVGILYENMVKWGDPKILISNNDPSDIGKLQGFFDVMLVDAPCSGSGLFRKDKDAIGEWSMEAVKHCSDRQKRILADAIPALKESGLLMYSTCSYSPDENENVMDWLVAEMNMEPVRVDLPSEWGIIEVESIKGGYGYRFMPYKLDGEGFFIACFRHRKDFSDKSFREKKVSLLVPKEKALLGQWIKNIDELECVKTKDQQIICVPADMMMEQLILSENLNLRKSGLLAGSLIRDQFLPEHELSQSIMVHKNIPQISLDKSLALDYLRKMTIQIPVNEKGWYVVHHEGYHLGWIKHLGNRINNYYPASWRILMS